MFHQNYVPTQFAEIDGVVFVHPASAKSRWASLVWTIQPISESGSVGAVTCKLIVNQSQAIGILDIEGGIRLISGEFVKISFLRCCGMNSSLVTVVTEATFALPLATVVCVELLGVKLRRNCGVRPLRYL